MQEILKVWLITMIHCWDWGGDGGRWGVIGQFVVN